MATYTSNLDLKKPAQSDKIRIADINNNMDTIDSTIGAIGTRSVTEQLTDIEGSIAIVSTGNVHVAISAGQYIYIKGHDTLSDGLYTANSALAANATLSSSNVTAVSGGGLNSLSNHIAKLDAVNFANTRTDIKAELTDVNDYTFLNSGYLVICAKSSGYVRLSMNNTFVTHDIPANSWNSLFVFKGMKAHITPATAGNVEYAFINPVP